VVMKDIGQPRGCPPSRHLSGHLVKKGI
jgi:hypothetical protein